MKLSSSIATLLALAPLALAAGYDPIARRDSASLSARGGDSNANNANNNDRKGNRGNNNNNNGNGNGNDNNPTVVIDNSGSDVEAISVIGKGNDQIVVIWVNSGAGQPTQTVNPQVTVTQTVTANPDGSVGTATAPIAAATHTVTVGGGAGLVYQPDQLQAAVGDMVIFKFLSQNHTVTQSTFAQPCARMAGGLDSGFVPNPNNTVVPEPMVAMQVMTTDPIWLYCAQRGHCGKGMVMSINPTAEKTQAQFQAAAIAQNGTGEQSPITGGTPSAAPPLPPPASSAPPAGTDTPAAVPPPAASQTVPAGATGTQSIAVGTGTTLPDGSCQCMAVCGADSPLAVAGSFGGVAAGLPSRMLAIGQ